MREHYIVMTKGRLGSVIPRCIGYTLQSVPLMYDVIGIQLTFHRVACLYSLPLSTCDGLCFSPLATNRQKTSYLGNGERNQQATR